MILSEVASIIRSKNAGPFHITLDVLFSKENLFNKVKNSNIWNKDTISNIYGIKKSDIMECLTFEKAKAFKCTIKRKIPSGSFGDTDIYGAQQHIPLHGIEID